MPICDSQFRPRARERDWFGFRYERVQRIDRPLPLWGHSFRLGVHGAKDPVFATALGQATDTPSPSIETCGHADSWEPPVFVRDRSGDTPRPCPWSSAPPPPGKNLGDFRAAHVRCPARGLGGFAESLAAGGRGRRNPLGKPMDRPCGLVGGSGGRNQGSPSAAGSSERPPAVRSGEVAVGRCGRSATSGPAVRPRGRIRAAHSPGIAPSVFWETDPRSGEERKALYL